MLLEAIDAYQHAKREHKENVKAQYTDKTGKGGEITWFRASGLGDADRKQIYKFFAQNFPTIPKTAQNLRQLENGDYVHERYQKAWQEMGVLISMEERLSSKNDEYLKQFDWELAGHYDGLLDLNILRAHALGKVQIDSVFNEETGEYEIEVVLDDDYADEIGIYDAEGNFSEDYEPLAMVADIKTMNPWGFKRIKENADVSNIGGYLDQIMGYMYLLNTPYASIFIEAKDNNDTVEVQVLWTDLHDDPEDPYKYEWDEAIHGEPSRSKVRVVLTSERFFGSETEEGLVPRLTRIWKLRSRLLEADASGSFEELAEYFPSRCSDKADGFPCSWGHKTDKPSYCEFYAHCWDPATQGIGIRPLEEVPSASIWKIVDDETGEVTRVDSRKVPEGVTEDAFGALVQMGVLDLSSFALKEAVVTLPEAPVDEVSATAFNEDTLFTASGELILEPQVGERDAVALQYKTEDDKNAIDCVNCGKQNTYQRLANGGTKKCSYCKHVNVVTKS